MAFQPNNQGTENIFSNYQVEDINQVSSFTGKGFSERDIKLEAFRKCIIEGSKPLSLFSINGFQYDQREIYFNTVQSAISLFIPDLQHHHDLLRQYREIENKELDIEKQFNEDINLLKSDAKKKDHISQPNFFQANYIMIKERKDKKVIELYREKVVILSFLMHERSFYGDNLGEATFDDVEGEEEPLTEELKEEEDASSEEEIA